MPTELADPVESQSPVAAPLMNGERLYSFSAIATKIPGHRNNSHVNSSTVFRWATKGVRVGDAVIKLEACRLGSAWKTSLEAVARFSARLTAAAIPADTTGPTAPPAPTPAQRTRAAKVASTKADMIFGTSAKG
jgi:hypothetical protein